MPTKANVDSLSDLLQLHTTDAYKSMMSPLGEITTTAKPKVFQLTSEMCPKLLVNTRVYSKLIYVPDGSNQKPSDLTNKEAARYVAMNMFIDFVNALERDPSIEDLEVFLAEINAVGEKAFAPSEERGSVFGEMVAIALYKMIDQTIKQRKLFKQIVLSTQDAVEACTKDATEACTKDATEARTETESSNA